MKIDGFDETNHHPDLFTIKWAIQRGYYIPPKRMAELLRTDAPLSPEVREYAAGLLDGTIKQKNARPKKHAKRLPEKPESSVDIHKKVVERVFDRPYDEWVAVNYIDRYLDVMGRRRDARFDDAVDAAVAKFGIKNAETFRNNVTRKAYRTKK